jgi:hypothetical protein
MLDRGIQSSLQHIFLTKRQSTKLKQSHPYNIQQRKTKEVGWGNNKDMPKLERK